MLTQKDHEDIEAMLVKLEMRQNIAMSRMIDEKLFPIKEDIKEVKKEVKEFKVDLKEVKKDVSQVKRDVRGFSKRLDSDIMDTAKDVDRIKNHLGISTS